MKILVGYSHFKSAIDVRAKVEAWLERLRTHGFDVHGIPLTLNAPGPAFYWKELHSKWTRGDKQLLTFYEHLARTLEQFDVFVNLTGINVHPEFARRLPVFKVYCCFDDPEASEILSKPVAWAYDLCMIGNIACVDMYKSWGIKEARWWPHGFRVTDYNPVVTEDQIMEGYRDVDISLLCERESTWRTDRLDEFVKAFPNGSYFGKGWPNGYLPETEKPDLMSRTKIGPNFHNSIGPVNFRTFILPANGIVQICDNKSNLGKIFELGREAEGFDNVHEAIELCRYYLAHDRERREMALRGWQRAHRDYNEVAIWQRLIDAIRETKQREEPRAGSSLIYIRLKNQRIKGGIHRILSLRPGIRTAIRRAFKKLMNSLGADGDARKQS